MTHETPISEKALFDKHMGVKPTVNSVLTELKERLCKPNPLDDSARRFVENSVDELLAKDALPHNPEVDKIILSHVPGLIRILDNPGVTSFYFMSEWYHLSTYCGLVRHVSSTPQSA